MEIVNGKRGGRVMPAQLLLNIVIAFLWMLLIDEDEIIMETFFAGFLVGIGVIFLMHRFFGTRFYLRRVFAVFKLLLIFNWVLIQSSVLVFKQI